MRTSTVARFLVAAAVVVVLAIGAIAAAASQTGFAAKTAAVASPSQSPTAKPTAPTYCQRFIQHLAGDLRKSDSDLSSAIKKATSQTIDDALKAGALTSGQAKRLRQALASNSLCSASFNNLRRLQPLKRNPQPTPTLPAPLTD